MKNHAQIWKRWRVKHLLSQAHMASALGLQKRTVQYVESGRNPSYTSQQRFEALVERYRVNRRKHVV